MMSQTAFPAFKRDGFSTKSLLALLWCCFLLVPTAVQASDQQGVEVKNHLPVSLESLVTLHSSPWAADWALVDFDGDHQPDLARTEVLKLRNASNCYRVNVTLSLGASSSFEFRLSRPAGINIEARDIDGDRDLDLVITSGVFRQPVGLWINNGTGTFAPADSRLYPDSVWRGPPALTSHQSSDDLNAVLEGLPFSLATTLPAVSEPLFTASRGLRNTDFCSHRFLFLLGPLSVRPPPSC